MANYKCPSCGARYNGKRCRNCLYERFTEEIAHGNHTHEGEPLVIDAPTRRPIRTKNPFDCERKTKKLSKSQLSVILAIGLALLGPVSDIAGDILSHKMDTFSYATAEPEPMPVPVDAKILYMDNGLSILAEWENGQEYTADGIRIWVENDTGYDLTVVAEDVIVNGYMMDTTYFYCDIRDGSHSMNTLYLDETALANAGISAVTDIGFHLEAWEQDTYATITTTHRIELSAAPPAGTVVHVAPKGELIYAQDGVRVSFLGYREDEYYPEDVSEGQLLFHIENNTDRYLQVFTMETFVNGEASDLSLWCQLYPGTKAVTPMYLYPVEDMDITTAEELFPLDLTLEADDPDDREFLLLSNVLTLTEGMLEGTP